MTIRKTRCLFVLPTLPSLSRWDEPVWKAVSAIQAIFWSFYFSDLFKRRNEGAGCYFICRSSLPGKQSKIQELFLLPSLLSFQLSSQAPRGLCSARSWQQGPAICQLSSAAALRSTSQHRLHLTHTGLLGTHSLTVHDNSLII